jgi:hypothetical protein
MPTPNSSTAIIGNCVSYARGLDGSCATSATSLQRSGLRKAKVAVARKLAVSAPDVWIEGTEFRWSPKEAINQPA